MNKLIETELTVDQKDYAKRLQILITGYNDQFTQKSLLSSFEFKNDNNSNEKNKNLKQIEVTHKNTRFQLLYHKYDNHNEIAGVHCNISVYKIMTKLCSTV